jgi:hypothetical protein
MSTAEYSYEGEFPDWLEAIAKCVHEMVGTQQGWNRFRVMLQRWHDEHDAEDTRVLSLTKSLTEAGRHAALAAIHGVVMPSHEQIDLWGLDCTGNVAQWKHGIPYMVLQSHVRDVSDGDRGWLEELLVDVRQELKAVGDVPLGAGLDHMFAPAVSPREALGHDRTNEPKLEIDDPRGPAEETHTPANEPLPPREAEVLAAIPHGPASKMASEIAQALKLAGDGARAVRSAVKRLRAKDHDIRNKHQAGYYLP